MTLNESDVQKILTSKLRNAPFTLRNFQIETLKADGMMGEHFQLTCHTEEDNHEKTHKFFVKKKSPHPGFGELPELVFGKERATFEMFETIANFTRNNKTTQHEFQTENNQDCVGSEKTNEKDPTQHINETKKTIESINKSLPKCFYSDSEHLVFEDLTVENYIIQTPSRVSTPKELEIILNTLARIHAGGIAFEEHTAKKLPEHFKQVFNELYLNTDNAVVEKYFSAILKGCETGIQVFNLPETLRNGKNIYEQLKLLLKINQSVLTSNKYRNTICHCDLWPANIFIKYDENGRPQHAKIVDHQISRYLPPAFDVLDFIMLNTTREYRKLHLKQLQEDYFDVFGKCLKEYGVDVDEVYSFEEFLESFEDAELFGVFSALATIPMVYDVENSLKNIMSSEGMNDIVFEDRSPLIMNCLKNQALKERVKDCFLDMVDYFEKN